MKPAKTASLEILIIGYGNPHRQDDGLGPYVVNRLKKRLNHIPGVYFLTMHQLTADIVEKLQYFDIIFFIDATVDELRYGFKFSKVKPEFGLSHYLTHYLKPSLLLGLLQSTYHHNPVTVEVAIQGNNFGFRQELTSEAKTRAEKAISEIVKFTTQSLKKCSNRNENPLVFIDLNEPDKIFCKCKIRLNKTLAKT